MSVRIVVGDCRAVLPTLTAGSVSCVVTSPPYWGLRDYGVEGQIGLERTPEEYVASLVAVFRAVRRVLREDGTLWLNLGDCYATGAGKVGERPGGGVQGDAWKERGVMTAPNRLPLPGLKAKDLVGMPWRVAFALQADGWWLRADIVWAKPNPMPESIQDRPTKAHEYVFLLAKSERYFYDAAAIAERSVETAAGNGERHVADGTRGRPADHRGSSIPWTGTTRNARSVWTIPTEPYPDAHFATFPAALAQRCMLAGCPRGGTVLDPFAGSGTVGEVATALGRHAILIELNPAYVKLAEQRTAQAGLFAGVTTHAP